jgi:hypothetical protein
MSTLSASAIVAATGAALIGTATLVSSAVVSGVSSLWSFAASKFSSSSVEPKDNSEDTPEVNPVLASMKTDPSVAAEAAATAATAANAPANAAPVNFVLDEEEENKEEEETAPSGPSGPSA